MKAEDLVVNLSLDSSAFEAGIARTMDSVARLNAVSAPAVRLACLQMAREDCGGQLAYNNPETAQALEKLARNYVNFCFDRPIED